MPEDTEAALEWADYQASLCSGCGNPRADCMDPANEGAYEAVPLTCFACATRDAEHRQVAEAQAVGKYGQTSFDGLYVAITPKGDD